MLVKISMDPNIKFTAAIIEILVFFCILFYLIIKTYSKFKIDDTQKNWHKHKSNPMILPFSGFFGKDFTSNFTGFIGSKVGIIFKPITNIFYFILGVFSRIFNYFMKSINKIRYLTKPIRLFFKRTAMMFYKKLSNFTLAITYTVHKMRNALRRSVSGFNMMFHTLHHIQFAFLSIWNSPIVPMTEKFLPIADFVYKAFKELGFCFDGDTLINTLNGKIKIKNLVPGNKLSNDNEIISCQQFINNTIMYNYKGIIVSGSHLVKENNNWLRVCDSNLSFPVKFPDKYIYCLTTSKGIIPIKSIIFKDFSESDNYRLNHNINDIILQELNQTKIIRNKFTCNYIEHGLDGNITINNKNIKDIQVGDKINNSIILGKIIINARKLDIYKYKQKYILSGNVKVNEKDLWIKVKDSYYSEPIINYKNEYLYHLITSNEKLLLHNTLEICDYFEIHDKYINDKIDTLVSKYYNNV
jgi:hypothetical protein